MLRVGYGLGVHARLAASANRTPVLKRFPASRGRPEALIAGLLSIMLHVGAAVVLSISSGEVDLRTSFVNADLDPGPVIHVRLVRPALDFPRGPVPDSAASALAKPVVANGPPRPVSQADGPSPSIAEPLNTGTSTDSSRSAPIPGSGGRAVLRGRCLWRGALTETEKAICVGRESGQRVVAGATGPAP